MSEVRFFEVESVLKHFLLTPPSRHNLHLAHVQSQPSTFIQVLMAPRHWGSQEMALLVFDFNKMKSWA